jgi:exonuclease SbcC
LFLDEGFGSLDSDTLDTVVDALDTLHGGDRVVGIVTHVRELAERLPARLEVARAGKTSNNKVLCAQDAQLKLPVGMNNSCRGSR